MKLRQRYLLASDLHIKLETLDLSFRILDDIIEICRSKDLGLIILGDLFHTKAIIRSECLNLVLDKLVKSGLDIVLLVGNHDFENKRCERHALESLKLVSNITVVDSILEVENLGFISYCSDEEFKKKVKTLSKDVQYVFCHQGIEGTMMNNKKPDNTSSIKLGDLKRFLRVFAGHYHLPQEKNNLIYVGSPYQEDFGETNQIKRFIVFDRAVNSLEYLPTTSRYPEYKIFKRNASDILSSQELDFKCLIQPIDHVRLDVVGSKEECKKITKALVMKKLGFEGDLRLQSLYNDSEKQVTIEDTLDYGKMYELWVRAQDTKLDKDTLIKLGMEKINSANLQV